MTRASLFAVLLASAAAPSALAAQTFSLSSSGGSLGSFEANPIATLGQTFSLDREAQLNSVALAILPTLGPVNFRVDVFAWDRETSRTQGDFLSFGMGTTGSPEVSAAVVTDVAPNVTTAMEGETLAPGDYAFVVSPTTFASLALQVRGQSDPAGGAFEGGDLILSNPGCLFGAPGAVETKFDLCYLPFTDTTPIGQIFNVLTNQDLVFELVFTGLANPLDTTAAALITATQLTAGQQRRRIGARVGDSITTRARSLPYTLGTKSLPGGDEAAEQQSFASKSAPGMMGNVYTWVEVTGFHAKDDTAGQSFRGAGLQIGADVALGANAVAGVSLGTDRIAAREGTLNYDGDMVFLQPYLGYRNGAWAAEASLLFGRGDFDQSDVGGTGEGETRVRAVSLSGSYAFAYGAATITPSLGVTVGTQTLEGTGGTLAGAGKADVDFSQVSVGARASRPYGNGEVFAGLYGDYSNSDSKVTAVSSQLVDDGWTGRVEFGGSFEPRRGLGLDTSVEFGGLGGDLKQVSGGLKATFRF